MSAIITTPAYKCYFNHGPEGPPFNDSKHCSGLSSLEQGGVTAAMPAGSWLGALISGFISDRLGRKYAIMSGCIVWYVTVLSNICLYFDLPRHFIEQQLTFRLCLGLLAPLSSVLPRTWVC
jgi:MFS family permease